MLDSRESNRRSERNEAAVAEQFRKLKYLVKRLDSRSSKRRRPDFLISTPSVRPQMLCEVKTVDSASYPRDKKKYGVENVHISMHDDQLCGPFKNIPIDLNKIDIALADAIDKRKALLEDDPSLDLPLLVAFAFDFFADHVVFYPRSFDERDESFREVSGILTIAQDIERKKALDKLSLEELERRVKADFEANAPVNDDLPPHSAAFVLVRNKAAIREVPSDFQILCITEPNDGLL
jgi:hypothetical protein